MAQPLNPEWRVVAYPRTAIPRRKYEPYVIADLMADVMAGTSSDWGGILMRGAQAGKWTDWARLDSNLQLQNVGFCRFAPGGSIQWAADAGASGGAAGFFAKPKMIACFPAGGEIGAPSPPSGQTALTWGTASGKWVWVPSRMTNGSPGIFNTENNSEARTSEPWPEGRGFYFDITAWSQGQAASVGEPAEILITFSPVLRLAARQDGPWLLERSPDQGKTWEVWTKSEVPFDALGRHYQVEVFILGGRLCWTINGVSKWLLDRDGNASSDIPKTTKNGAPYTADLVKYIGGAPLSMSVRGCRARLEVAAREYPEPGTVTRKIKRQSNAAMRAVGVDPTGIGQLPPDSGLIATSTTDSDTIEYTVTIKPDDGKLHSPFLSRLLLVHEPVWENGTGTGVDISAAITSGKVTLAHPPVQAGSQGELTFSIEIAEALIPSWDEVVDTYCPIEVSARWYMDDDSYSDWSNLFRGYIMKISGVQEVYNNSTLTLELKDPVCRLMAPAAVVEGNAIPLDHFYKKQLGRNIRIARAEHEAMEPEYNFDGTISNVRTLSRRETSYYDCQGVRDILFQFLGPSESSKINGNGDPFRYVPSDHPSLLDLSNAAGSWLGVAHTYGITLTAGSLQAQEGAFLPPPYEEDALKWINKLCADFKTVFLYGHVNRNSSSWPVPIYGTYERILQNAMTFQISGVDAEKLLAESARYDTKPENDYNAVLVLSNPFGATKPPGTPAMTQGEARLAPTHPRSQENTWRRTMVEKNNLAASPKTAAVYAAGILRGLRHAYAQWPEYKLPRGDGRVQPGDKFTAADDGHLPIAGVTFRAQVVEHEYNVSETDARTWATTVRLEPLPT